MVGSAAGGGGDHFERIVPLAPNTPASEPAPNKTASMRFVAWRLPAAFAVLLLIAVAVLFWLPKTVSQPAPVGSNTPVNAAAQPAASTAPQPALAEPPADVEAALQQRQQAESLAAQLHALQANLTAMHAPQWAAKDVELLTRDATQAEAQFVARDYSAAISSYEQAVGSARQLQIRAGEVLTAALADGHNALQAGDPTSAAAAYARAISIDATNPEAIAGQRRALNFDAVQAHLNKAEAAQSQGDLAAARAGFQQVLALDGDNETARAALARLQSAAANTAFATQMSRGLAALDQGDYNAAQVAFNTALKMRAGAAEARDGLERARLGMQAARVQSLRETAQQAEAIEQWSAARAAYAAALAIDASLAFAQRGQERAAQRAALAARLQAHIDQAHRLTAQSVRTDALAALADAVGIATPGPVLQAQIQRLTGLLESATTPVAVTLHSNGKTSVTLYPIGEIGSFASHSLSLSPGQYTAIGRRPGYREVRVAFTVSSQGVAHAPLIQCEEPI